MTLFHYYTYFKSFKNFDKFKLIVGCLFLAAGRIRLYTFNKKTNKFSILKTSILCCRTRQTLKLSEITGL